MPISHPGQCVRSLASPNINEWKHAPIQTNCLIQYNDKPVIKPEPNRMIFPTRPSPQNLSAANITTSVIRISPTKDQLSKNNHNSTLFWSAQNSITEHISTQATQHGNMNQGSIETIRNCSTLSEITGEHNVHCSLLSSISPLCDQRTTCNTNSDASVNYVKSPSTTNLHQSSVYETNDQLPTDYLVIRSNSNMTTAEKQNKFRQTINSCISSPHRIMDEQRPPHSLDFSPRSFRNFANKTTESTTNDLNTQVKN